MPRCIDAVSVPPPEHQTLRENSPMEIDGLWLVDLHHSLDWGSMEHPLEPQDSRKVLDPKSPLLQSLVPNVQEAKPLVEVDQLVQEVDMLDHQPLGQEGLQ